jgi:hypothetical protein
MSVNATQWTAERFLEWARTDEAVKFYTDHPSDLEPEDIRMLIAYHRLGGKPSDHLGVSIARASRTMLEQGDRGFGAFSYMLSLLTPSERMQVKNESAWVFTEARQDLVLTLLPPDEERASEESITEVAPTSAPEILNGVRQVRLSHQLEYWSPEEYLDWCESDEGKVFYWFCRHNKTGGPNDTIGACDPPERIRKRLAHLREWKRTGAPDYDGEDEWVLRFLVGSRVRNNLPKDQCVADSADLELFNFLQRQEPHAGQIHFPQPFLYAISLLTPLEYSRSRCATRGGDGWNYPSNQHPNARTMRWITSREAENVNAHANAIRARAALKRSKILHKIVLKAGQGVDDILTQFAVPGPCAYHIPVNLAPSDNLVFDPPLPTNTSVISMSSGSKRKACDPARDAAEKPKDGDKDGVKDAVLAEKDSDVATAPKKARNVVQPTS